MKNKYNHQNHYKWKEVGYTNIEFIEKDCQEFVGKILTHHTTSERITVYF